MNLTTLKHGGHWDFVARIFKISAASLGRMVIRFIESMSDDFYNLFVVQALEMWKMERTIEYKKNFATIRVLATQ